MTTNRTAQRSSKPRWQPRPRPGYADNDSYRGRRYRAWGLIGSMQGRVQGRKRRALFAHTARVIWQKPRPVSKEQLATFTGIPVDTVQWLMSALCATGWLIEVSPATPDLGPVYDFGPKALQAGLQGLRTAK